MQIRKRDGNDNENTHLRHSAQDTALSFFTLGTATTSLNVDADGCMMTRVWRQSCLKTIYTHSEGLLAEVRTSH
jgi:hypothetical protein